MEFIQNTISIVMVIAGIFFMFVGGLGVVRLPDFYTRTHAVSKSDTLGILFVIGGLAVYEGLTLTSLKLLLVVLFVALANPIGSHALGGAAYHGKVKPQLTLKQQKKEEETK